jgi:hypothetical protein
MGITQAYRCVWLGEFEMLKDLIEEIYSSARCDDWSGELISSETEKVHQTMRRALEVVASVMTSATATVEEKKWARDKIDALL